MFPAIARYVDGYGYIEIGDQEGFGFVVRAIGYGGMDFEDDRPDTLAEAMAVLEAGLARWFEEQGVEISSNGPIGYPVAIVPPRPEPGAVPAVSPESGHVTVQIN